MPGKIAFEDYVAICEVKARYCRCMDTKDWAGFAEVFTEDFVLDTTPAGGEKVIHGRDAAVASTKSLVGEAQTAHQVHSPEMTINGDVAEVIWALEDRVVWSKDRRPSHGVSGLTGYGHYHERYVRKDGKWRIATLRLTRLVVDMDPARD